PELGVLSQDSLGGGGRVHRAQEGGKVLFVLREFHVALRAYLDGRQVGGIGLSQEAFRRHMVPIAFQRGSPSAAVYAPRLLPFVDKFPDPVHSGLIPAPSASRTCRSHNAVDIGCASFRWKDILGDVPLPKPQRVSPFPDGRPPRGYLAG